MSYQVDSYGNAYFPAGVSVASIPATTGTQNKVLVPGPDGKISSASISQLITQSGGNLVSSIFGRTGAITALRGDYNTDQVTEGQALYFTNGRARKVISVTTFNTSGPATYDSTTGIINIPQYGSGVVDNYVPVTRTITINGQTADLSANRTFTIDAMVYPSVGIPVSNGTAWGNSIVNNSSNWNTAYSWGDHAGLYSLLGHTHTFSSLTSKPTTLAGYGITDAATSTQGTRADTAFGWGDHSTAGYLTSATAASIYLTQSAASSTYLTSSTASTTYLTQSAAATTYLSQSSASTIYVSLLGSYSNPTFITSLSWSKISGAPAFLTSYTETDPVWTSEKINYYTKTQADGRYLQSFTETDPIWTSEKANYALKTYVDTSISNLVDAAPTTLNTLNELAAALGDDANFSTSITTLIGTKEPAITAGTTAQYWRGDKTWQTLPIYTLSGLGGVPTSRTLTINGTSYDLSADRSWSINSMVYPSAGIAVSTGSSWGTSITDNSTNWNTAYGWGNHASAGYLTTATAASTYASLSGAYSNPAFVASLAWSKITGAPAFLTSYTETDPIYTASSWYGTTNNASNWNTAFSDRFKWDGGSSGLNASTGRTSLGLGTAATANTGDFAAASHTHSIANVSGLQTALDGKEPTITAGTTSQYWRGDKTWQTLPVYTLAGLGGQPQLNGTGFVKASGTTISYDNSTYYLASNPNGYISSYTEIDTLQSVILRNGTTNTGFTITNTNDTYSTPSSTNVPVIYLYNTGTTSTANAVLSLRTNSATGGDPILSFDIGGVQGWSMGIDNSDSDKFKIARSWAALDSDTRFSMAVDGTANFTGSLTAANLSGTNTGDQTNISGLAGSETLSTVTGRGAITSNSITTAGLIISTADVDIRVNRGRFQVYNNAGTGNLGYRIRTDENGGWRWQFVDGGNTEYFGVAYSSGVLTLRPSSGTIIERGGFTDFIGYNASYGSYIGGGVSNASNYLYAGGYFYDGSTVRTLIHSGNISSYAVTSLTDTLASVTGRGASTSTALSIDNNITITSGRLIVRTGGINTYGVVSGYDNNNHMMTFRAAVTGPTASPTYTPSHQMTFIEYAQDNDTTGWFFKSSSNTNYEEIARVTRTGIYWNGYTVWHSGNSHTHDDRYYTESESISLFARRDTSTNINGNLVLGNTAYNQSNAYNNWGARLFFNGSDSDAQGNYYIGTNNEDYGGNYSKLDLRWHTGIRMGAQANYGGVRFYNSEDLGTVIFSVGTGDANVRVSNNLYVSGEVTSGGNFEMRGAWSNSPFPNSSWVRATSGGGLFLVNNSINAWAGLKTDGSFHVSNSASFASSLSVSSGLSASNVYSDNGYRNAGNYFEKLLGVPYFDNGVSNLAIDLVLGNVSWWGYFEIEITSTYSYQSSGGKLTKVFATSTNPGGSIYTNESRIVDSMGDVPVNIAIGDFTWSSSRGAFIVPIYHIVNTGNSYTIKVRMFSHGGGAESVYNAMYLSSIYTQSGGIGRQWPFFNSRLGIATTTPSYNLDVNGNARISNITVHEAAVRMNSGSGGNSPKLVFGTEDESVAGHKSIYLETYWMVIQPHVNEGLRLRFVNGSGSQTEAITFQSTNTTIRTKITYNDNTYMTGSPSYGFRFNSANDAYNNVIMHDSGHMSIRNRLRVGGTGDNPDCMAVITGNSGASGYSATDMNNILHLTRNSHSYILFSSPDGYDQGFHFYNSSDNSFVGRIAYTHNGSSDKLLFSVNSAIRVEINASGTLTASGDVVAYGSPSDARLKTIKEKVPNALDKILKLNGYRFDWNKVDSLTNIKEDVGVIAQEVEAVIPELARTNDDGQMSVRYQGLTAVLIEAIKEQQLQIEELKKEIKELKNK